MNIDNPLNNLDIISIEPIKYYDRRNKKLSNYNLVILEGKECLITKKKHEEIDEHNRVIRNKDLEFLRYLNKQM
jgi:hypothetical protein